MQNKNTNKNTKQNTDTTALLNRIRALEIATVESKLKEQELEQTLNNMRL